MAISMADLEQSKGRKNTPPKIVLYGTHGIGKSTFAAEAPNPLFIDTEDGTDHLDVYRQHCTKLEDVYAVFDLLQSGEHPFKTVVIDTLDWLEKIIHERVRKEHGEQVFTDYGRGYVHSLPFFDTILRSLTHFNKTHKLGVILLAHCQIKRFDSPEHDPYDRYQLDLHDKAAHKVEQWADAVLFANYETFVKKTDVGFGKEKKRGLGTGRRVIHTEERPAFKAKNRYKLPEMMDLNWEQFMGHYTNFLNNKEAASEEQPSK